MSSAIKRRDSSLTSTVRRLTTLALAPLRLAADVRLIDLDHALLASFDRDLEVTAAADSTCIVTLPLKTADDRYIDVFVEPMRGSSTFIYDGGKNSAELYAQGLHPTDTQDQLMKGIAAAHGAQFQNGRFQILCRNADEVQAAVIAIGQCASLAMVDVVTHSPSISRRSASVQSGPNAKRVAPQLCGNQA